MASNEQPSPVVVMDYAYTERLLRKLDNQQSSGRFTNFTIWVKNYPLPVDKNVLAAGSDYFQTLFQVNLMEAEKDEVHLEMELDVVQKVVKYLYTGVISITQENIKKLVAAAEYFHLKELRNQCVLFLRENVEITAATAISWLQFGTLYGLSDIIMRSRKIIQTQFVDVVQGAEFRNLELAEVCDLISDSDIIVSNEDAILQATIDWVNHAEERQKHFSKLIDHVNLIYCTPVFLKYVNQRYSSLVDEVKSKFLEVAMAKMSVCNETTTVYPRHSYRNADEIVIYGGCTFANEKQSVLSKFFTPGDPHVENTKCYYLDQTSMEWVTFTEIPSNIEGAYKNICKTDNGAVIIGRSKYDADTNAESVSGVMYSALSGKLENVFPFPVQVPQISASAMIGDGMFIIGGSDSNRLYMLNLKNQVWSEKSPMPYRASHPTVAAHGVSIYVFGSRDKNQCYNTITDKWSTMVDVPPGMTTNRVHTVTVKVYGASAVTVKDSIFIVGGQHKLCAEYHVHQDLWTLHKSCDKVHMFGSAFFCQKSGDGKIVLTGGSEKSDTWKSMTDVIEEYDLRTDEWKTWELKLPVKLAGHGAMGQRIRGK